LQGKDKAEGGEIFPTRHRSEPLHGFAFGVSKVETAVQGFFIIAGNRRPRRGWQNALKVLIHGIEGFFKARCRRVVKFSIRNSIQCARL